VCGWGCAYDKVARGDGVDNAANQPISQQTLASTNPPPGNA
jgi:hypothetical protein